MLGPYGGLLEPVCGSTKEGDPLKPDLPGVVSKPCARGFGCDEKSIE